MITLLVNANNLEVVYTIPICGSHFKKKDLSASFLISTPIEATVCVRKKFSNFLY